MSTYYYFGCKKCKKQKNIFLFQMIGIKDNFDKAFNEYKSYREKREKDFKDELERNGFGSQPK